PLSSKATRIKPHFAFMSKNPGKNRNICVFCGSNMGKSSAYLEMVEQLADALIARDWGMVYGGASVGVMGALADRMLSRGGRVTGVIPQALVAREVAHRNLTDLRFVNTM